MVTLKCLRLTISRALLLDDGLVDNGKSFVTDRCLKIGKIDSHKFKDGVGTHQNLQRVPYPSEDSAHQN